MRASNKLFTDIVSYTMRTSNKLFTDIVSNTMRTDIISLQQ